MSTLKIAIALGVAALLSASAFAQSTMGDHDGQHRWGHEKAQTPEEWHKTMCVNRYAREVGKLAELEAKLGLNDKQKDLWAHWKQEKTSASAKGRDACLESPPKPDQRPTILEREAHLEKKLTARLHELQATRPALQALYDSLSAEQKAVLDRALSNGRHHHWGMGPEGRQHHHFGEQQ